MMETWHEMIERYLREGRTVSGGKGDPLAKQSEQLSIQNQQQQLKFNDQLIQIFQKQYDKQTEAYNYLTDKMKPEVENPTGYSDKALAAMHTSSADTISRNSQNEKQALQAQRFAQGGRDLPSGVDEQLNQALADSESAQKSSADQAIDVQNENLKQSNRWNALNVLSGVGAQFNPQSYAGSATGAANSASEAGNATSNASQAYKASQSSGIMGALGGIAGGVGSALGGYFGKH